MPNDVSFLKAEAWATTLQEVLYPANVLMNIVDRRYEGDFDGTDTIHIPYMDRIVALPLATSYSDVTLQSLVTGEDTMTLADRQHWAVPLSVEDMKEMKISPENRFIKDGAAAFAEAYDDSIAAHYTDAALTVTDGDMGTATNGGGTNPIDLDLGSEVYEMIVRMNQELNVANVPQNDRWIVLSPKEEALLSLDTTYLIRSTSMGDGIISGGFMGRINGVKIYTSNNLVVTGGNRHLLGG